ncbi:GDP-mannose-dependent alpha-mannosyltransferase [Nesterenkonia sp. AN1]|uniref:glycosyltransferase family 4 protein n=1 Tax=Nesterenkonia TaxID=57494 RepID=UPI000446BBCA|nr:MULTISPECIES: glycosyltransferase family 1 protein [Nesterenkonia]EXF26082.1 GDP-mannose-dependent alpha-mannosyltransferase [Nesterenkonia sp. AN1]
MRVVVVTESFLPHMNGVTNSVLHVLAHLRRRGDDVTVIAPSDTMFDAVARTEPGSPVRELCEGFPVIRVPSLPLPDYPKVRVAAGFVTRIRHLLEQIRPDVVHVASPFVLGWRAIQAAGALGVPTVSIYQTEVPTYAARYGLPWAAELLWQHVDRMHSASTLTLVPSSFCREQLTRRGIKRLKTWRRGVDTRRFSPERRSQALRAQISGWAAAPGGSGSAPDEKLIGFVGRLASEKQVQDLAVLDALPGTRLVIIGSGPQEDALRRALPRAHFAGFQSGEELGAHVASLDVFVHPGEAETFCQTIQEAMAAGVPVVAVGRGGPLDLVDVGRTGWLYRPGDLTGLRSAVEHLIGDDAARRDFGRRAHESVQDRTWEALSNELIGHYARAVEVNRRVRTMHPRPRRFASSAGAAAEASSTS